jgi:ribosomal protein S18 acetylase RimI-like enzyme
MLQIRRATLDDLAALEPMMVAFNAAEHIAWDPASARPAVERLLASDELGFILVAADAFGAAEAAAPTGSVTRGDGALAGYTVVTWGFDLEFAGRDAMLTELYVGPAHRRHHLGTTLVESAMARAADSGAAAIHLMVDPANPGAIALYRRADFEPSRRVMMTRVFVR